MLTATHSPQLALLSQVAFVFTFSVHNFERNDQCTFGSRPLISFEVQRFESLLFMILLFVLILVTDFVVENSFHFSLIIKIIL